MLQLKILHDTTWCSQIKKFIKREMVIREFPGSSVIRTKSFHCQGLGKKEREREREREMEIKHPDPELKLNRQD